MSALVATVVPWEKRVTSLRSIFASSSPRIAPTSGSSGVDAVLATLSAPESSSRMQMSVNVPPTSTPTRNRAFEFFHLSLFFIELYHYYKTQIFVPDCLSVRFPQAPGLQFLSSRSPPVARHAAQFRHTPPCPRCASGHPCDIPKASVCAPLTIVGVATNVATGPSTVTEYVEQVTDCAVRAHPTLCRRWSALSTKRFDPTRDSALRRALLPPT